MKYSEFKRDIEEMGYSIVNGKDDLYVRKRRHRMIISIGLNSTYVIDSKFESFKDLEDLEKERLLNLAWQLASTPLDERVNEKRYRLKLPFVKDDLKYLTVRKATGDLTVSYLAPYYEDYQGEFTETEIKELKRKHNLDSFVLEEVKEDE